MRHLFKLTVRTALNMDLVDMAVQAIIDGTKLQASAAKDRTYNAKGLQQLLERIDTIIEEMEKQNEAGDDFAPVHLPEKLRHIQLLRTEVKAAIEKLETEDGAKRVGSTILSVKKGLIEKHPLTS